MVVENEKKTRVFLFHHKRIIVVVLTLLITLVSLEAYAQTYVQIHILPVVTEADAQNREAQVFDGSNSFFKLDNFTFSSSGCRWLLILETEKNVTDPNGAISFIDIFKTEQKGSLFVYGTDLQILNVAVQYVNGPEQGATFSKVDTFDYSNYTTVRVTYEWVSLGTYDALFNLTVRVYQRTLIGIIPKEQVTIPLNTTLTLTSF